LNNTQRLSREIKTIKIMIQMYCTSKHNTKNKALCSSCFKIEAYALQRIDHCPFKTDKPTCVKCPVHCYMTEKREMIRQIMRHSGPRMLVSHPILAYWHIVDGRRKWNPTIPDKRGDLRP